MRRGMHMQRPAAGAPARAREVTLACARGRSVSDHDNWSDPSKAARPSWGKEAEDKLFDALEQEDPSGRWKEEAWLRPMGEQRRKPFKRHYPTLDSSLDEAPGRRLAHGGLIPRPNKIVLVRHGESQVPSPPLERFAIPSTRSLPSPVCHNAMTSQCHDVTTL